MRDWLEKLLDIPSVCTDRSMLEEGLAELAAHFGFDGYAFVNLRAGEDFACSNCPVDWQLLYQSRSYRQIDPVIRQARRQKSAFAWSADGYRRNLCDEERRLFAHAADYGIVSGVSMPVATPNGSMSMLTFASSRAMPIADVKIDAIGAASAIGQLHARFDALDVNPAIKGEFHLSAKEARYLQWLTLGKTVEDAAELEGVKYNTVRIALAEARRRYNLCNNTQLVASAIRKGLL